jgi:hypothetical protein
MMKWMKDAKQGIVCAGGQVKSNSLTQLYSPMRVMVNHLCNVYVADNGNDRIMHWPTGSAEGNNCCWWKWKKK